MTTVVGDHDHHRGASLERFGFGGAGNGLRDVQRQHPLRWELRMKRHLERNCTEQERNELSEFHDPANPFWKRRWPPLLGCSRFRFGYKRWVK